jgi:outer membrane protein
MGSRATGTARVLVAVLAVSLPHLAGAQEAPSSPPPPTLELSYVGAVAGPAEALPVLGLDEALRRALARNPAVRVALDEIRRAEGLVLVARGPALPQLSANATGTELDRERVVSGTNAVVSAKTSLNANLTVGLPLLAPQRWVGWAHALENRDVSRISSKDVQRAVGIAVARAYLAVVAQHRLLEVNQLAVRTAKAHYDYAHGRLLGGLGRRLDEVRASREVATTSSNLEVSLYNLRRTQEALGVLLGEQGPLDALAEVALPAPPEGVEQGLSEAREKRTDVKLAEARKLAARHVVRDTYADYLPVLTGQLQPFFQTPATSTLPQRGWQALLIFGWTLYDGGTRQGLRQERAALESEATAMVEASLRQAQSEVRSAFEELKRADLALASSRRAAALASEALQLATEAYRLGATTNLEVIDAERAARDARTQAAIAEDAARQARVDLLAATGRFP